MDPDKLIRLFSIELSSSARSVFMPITIGVLFRQIVKDLQTQDNNLDSYLNNPNSDTNNPNYDINNPNSAINNQYSCINDASNTEKNKEIRRKALSDLIKMYLSDYVSEERGKKLVEEYIS
jgi:sugar-specific transcriptional regulator TrmB